MARGAMVVAAVAGSLLLPLVTHPFWIWDIGLWLAVELTAGDLEANRRRPLILVALLAVPLGALAATATYLTLRTLYRGPLMMPRDPIDTPSGPRAASNKIWLSDKPWMVIEP